MEFIGISYAGHGICVKKPATWDELLRVASERFGISATTVASLQVLYSNDMSGTAPLWEIDASTWPVVKPDSSIYLEVNEGAQGHGKDAASSATGNTHLTKSADAEIITICVSDHLRDPVANYFFRLKRNMRLERLMRKAAEHFGHHPTGCRFLFQGSRILPGDTPDVLELKDGDTVEMREEQKAGKPAIYLLSPTPLETVTVSVSLRPGWDFTVIYPITDKVKHTYKSTTEVTWVVSVQADGTLVNKSTGRQSSYLFWEACTASSDLPQLSSKDQDLAFNPAAPLAFFGLHHTTVTLPFESFEPYLDGVLESLTLTPAMRTEFIVYWLPSFQRIRDRGQDIQFTLVPQDAFDKAATLTISGAVPTAVARIFMLFRGVQHDEVADHAEQHGSAADWPRIVGLDVDSMKDESAFRVLEWGGMEVTMTAP